jgi:ABC-type branched-subunit amino acid transport system ATPase component
MSSGRIVFDDEDISKQSVSGVVARGIVQVPEGRRIFGRLSVEENLRLGGMRHSGKEVKASLEHVYGLFPRLGERRKQQGLLLSGGEQQMLAIGRGLMASPKLLMLDEPSLGLAPIIVEQIAEIIASISRSGVSILLIEQNANMALSVSDQAYVLELGRVSLSGASNELAKTDEIKHLYLGHSGGNEALEETTTVPAVIKTLEPWEATR